jgi:hypothetical protein
LGACVLVPFGVCVLALCPSEVRGACGFEFCPFEPRPGAPLGLCGFVPGATLLGLCVFVPGATLLGLCVFVPGATLLGLCAFVLLGVCGFVPGVTLLGLCASGGWRLGLLDRVGPCDPLGPFAGTEGVELEPWDPLTGEEVFEPWAACVPAPEEAGIPPAAGLDATGPLGPLRPGRVLPPLLPVLVLPGGFAPWLRPLLPLFGLPAGLVPPLPTGL